MSNDNLALLAAAAYGKFVDINKKDIQESLYKIDISKNQAEQFTNTYEIIAHQPNTESGYSGTIVRNKKTDEFFVLHRGTEPNDSSDWIQDGKLLITGLPYRQLVDAKRFVDDNIKNGKIQGHFTNVGHSLGKSIADLIHFTTNMSVGSIGFNGAGSSFIGDGQGFNFSNPLLAVPNIIIL